MARVPKSEGSGTVAVYVNRTPVLVEAKIIGSGGNLLINGGGIILSLDESAGERPL